MTPAFGASRLTGKPPVRMAFAYVPNGIMMPEWTPQAEGAAFDLPKLLQPIAPYRNKALGTGSLYRLPVRLPGPPKPRPECLRPRFSSDERRSGKWMRRG